MIFRGLLRLLSSALDRQSHESVPYSSALLIKSVLSSHSRRGTYESTHSWPSPLGKELSSASMLPCSETNETPSIDNVHIKGLTIPMLRRLSSQVRVAYRAWMGLQRRDQKSALCANHMHSAKCGSRELCTWAGIHNVMAVFTNTMSRSPRSES